MDVKLVQLPKYNGGKHMNCVKMMALSLSLLVVPAAFASGPGAAAPVVAGPGYVERAQTFVSNNSKAAIGFGAAVGAGAAYYLHTKNVFGFRTYVSNPAIGYVKAYVKNLKAGETKTVVATIAALLVGGYLVKEKYYKTAPVVTLDAQTLEILKNAKNASEVKNVMADVEAKARAAAKALADAVDAAEDKLNEAKKVKGFDAGSDEAKALQAAIDAAVAARDNKEAAAARQAAVDAVKAELQAYAADLTAGEVEINKTRFEAIKAAAHEAAEAKKRLKP